MKPLGQVCILFNEVSECSPIIPVENIFKHRLSTFMDAIAKMEPLRDPKFPRSLHCDANRLNGLGFVLMQKQPD